MEKEKQWWEQVVLNLGPHIQGKLEDIIDLSYRHLPYHLKPCFLYFGLFPEDKEIQVSKLTWLWTAEGLVKNHTEKLPEDIAEFYLENLIGRNLATVSKKSSDGKTKACRVHDLVLDFCIKKAKAANFLECIKSGNDMNPPPISDQKYDIPQHLCLYLQDDNLAEWSLSCSHVRSFHLKEGRQIALSSIDHASHIFNNFKFLRVLNMELTVIDSFPVALACLRYVAVRIAEGTSLSLSTSLWNLETLIVKGLGGQVSLPITLWKMVKLRHLHIYDRAIFTLNTGQEFLTNTLKLDDLQTLSAALFSCVEDADNLLAKTPNLQKLRCEVSRCEYGLSPSFNKLNKLEMLKFSSDGILAPIKHLNLPSNLKKLTLSDCCLHVSDQFAILPRLEVLKLLQVTINSEAWEVTNEQFPQLKFLKLQSPFSEWNVSDKAFPSLEHLVLKRCLYLKEIPSRFAEMSSLKSIEVLTCKESLVASAMVIRETQVEEMKNSGFELFIRSRTMII